MYCYFGKIILEGLYFLLSFRLHIGSLNVRGLNRPLKRRQIFSQIRRNKYDSFLIQETHATYDTAHTWEREWGGKIYRSDGESNARGVAIVCNRNLDINITNVIKDTEGRRLIISFVYEDAQYVLCCIYAPNRDDKNFFQQTFDLCTQENCENWIIGGDYNLVLDPNVDANSRINNNTASAEFIRSVMEETQLYDAWRLLHPADRLYTWSRRKPTVCMSRIDMFLISGGLLQACKGTDIEICPASDHSRITLKLEADEFQRGPGNWRFNNSLLNDDQFLTDLTLKCNLWKDIYQYLPPVERWEVFKGELSNFCRRESKIRARKCSHEETSLHEMAATIEMEMQKSDAPERLHNVMEEIKCRITELEQIQAQAAAFRARAKWIRDGERNTKYFFTLEKKNFLNKTMKRLRLPDGTTVTEQSVIMKHQVQFYKDLYTANEEIVFNLKNESGVYLNEDQTNCMKQDITYAESVTALEDMKNDKAPGCDGLTVNLFKVIWPIIGKMMIDMYNICLEKNELNPSARRGLVTLIPKKKDPSLLKNWRPLTLLNMDYKILAKIFALRIKTVLPSIIGEQQTGFMEKRCISDNIRKTIDVISHIYRSGRAALIVSIDYEKCFDKIEFSAVEGSLRYFKFPERFVRWATIFFRNFQICTSNAGFTSDLFKKSRGVNQGCPISPYLFLVCGETMAHLIKQNQLIKGVKLGSRTHVISQFADDTMLFLTYDLVTIEETIRTLTIVEANTGLQISYEKTTVYRIGSIKNSDAMFVTQKQLKWTSGDLDVLGVTISNSEKQSSGVYDSCLDKVQSVAALWYHRNFSLIGKIMIINALMASVFVYKMSVFGQLEARQTKRWYSIIEDFLWCGRRAKIPRRVLEAHKKEGGLKLGCLEKRQESLMIRWVAQANTENFQYCSEFLIPELGMLIWQCNIKQSDVQAMFQPSFWSLVLEKWAKYHFIQKHAGTEVMEQIIWFNSSIVVNNRPMWNIKAFKAGIVRFLDLLDADNNVYSYDSFCKHYGYVLNWLEFQQIVCAIPKTWWAQVHVNTGSPFSEKCGQYCPS